MQPTRFSGAVALCDVVERVGWQTCNGGPNRDRAAAWFATPGPVSRGAFFVSSILFACVVFGSRAARAQRSSPLHVVLVVDASTAMARHDRTLAARAASKLLVDLLGPTDSLSLVAFGTEAAEPATIVGSERDRARAAIDGLTRSAARADWGVGLEAAASLVSRSADARSARWLVVVLAANADPSERPESALEAAATTLATNGALSFVVGLGSELASPSANATRDAMNDAAVRTGGSYLAADAAALPRTFLTLLGARTGFLVGAPTRVGPGMPRITVRAGTRRLIVVALGGGSAPLSLVRYPPARPTPRNRAVVDAGLDGATPTSIPSSPSDVDAGDSPAGEAWPFGRASDAFVRDLSAEPAAGGAGYALWSIARPPPGEYAIGVASPGRPLPEVIVVRDVGIRLVLRGIGRHVVPEAPLRVGAILRAANGSALDLPADLRREMEVGIVAGPHAARHLLLDATGATDTDLPPLEVGEHVVEARLRHFRGLVQVEPARLTTTSRRLSTVAPRTRQPRVTFDEAMRERIEIPARLQLGPATQIAEPLTFDLRFADMVHADELELAPSSVVLDTGSETVDFAVRVKQPHRLPPSGRVYTGQIRFTPRAPEKLRGQPVLVVHVQGRVRPWTRADWVAAYQWHALGGVTAVAMLVGSIVVAVRARRRRRTPR